VGRSLTDFGKLSPAEAALLLSCRVGNTAKISETRPKRFNPENTIRAAFLRFLMLGGDEEAPVHENGVFVTGAWIEGILAMNGARSDLRLSLSRCRIERIEARHAQLRLLNLGGSYLKRGFAGDGLSISGLFLRRGFRSTGQVRLPGAKIAGNLECVGGTFDSSGETALLLDGINVDGSVLLSDGFHARASVRLNHAKIGAALDCDDSRVDSLKGVALSLQHARISGSAFFRRAQFVGVLRMHGAKIDGNIEADGGRFDNPGEIAINAERVVVEGGVFFRNGFQANGGVYFRNAAIGGDVEAMDGQFQAPGRVALTFTSARISGSVWLKSGFSSQGSVSFRGARIAESLICSGGHFEAPGDHALTAERASIDGTVFLRTGFKAIGQVRFVRARIGGGLECNGADLQHEGIALSCQNAVIQGPVFLRHGFHAKGEVSFLGAQLSGNLECMGGRFEHPEGVALGCTDALILGTVYLSAGFSAQGTVTFAGAKIAGVLQCSAGKFEAKATPALSLVTATVARSVFLSDGFEAYGEVRLASALLEAGLNCSGGTFVNPGGIALGCARVRVRARLVLESITRIDGLLDLTDTHVSTLCDDMAVWRHAKGNFLADGFSYDRFGGDSPTDSRQRIEWLDLQRPDQLDEVQFRPQPWEHLVSILKKMGHAHEARAVAVAKQIRLRRARRIPFGGVLMHRIYGGLVGYGYKPWRLLLSVTITWALSAGFYWAAVHPSRFGFPQHLIDQAKVDTVACGPEPSSSANATCSDPRHRYADFEPMIFSADVLLPVIDLDYASKWTVVVDDGQGRILAAGRILRYLYWCEIIFGWIAGLLLITVVRNLIKRE
jgi:hypothetical protein